MNALLWFTEFALELAGTRLARRRKIFLLQLFLGFRAFADLACALISLLAGQFFYSWAWYASAVIQYILLAVLIMYLSAKLLRADRYTMKFYSAAGGVMSFLAIAFFHTRPLTMTNILHFAAGMYMLLGAWAAISLMAGKNENWIWHGLAGLVLAASNGSLSALQAQHLNVTGLYPLGEIAALLLWCVALLQKEESAEEIRLPVTSVRTPVFGWVDKSGEGQIN